MATQPRASLIEQFPGGQFSGPDLPSEQEQAKKFEQRTDARKKLEESDAVPSMNKVEELDYNFDKARFLKELEVDFLTPNEQSMADQLSQQVEAFVKKYKGQTLDYELKEALQEALSKEQIRLKIQNNKATQNRVAFITQALNHFSQETVQ